MVITVEPGCYFNEFTLRPALKDAALAHLLVPERIAACMVRARLWAFGDTCPPILAAKEGPVLLHASWCCFTL